MKLFKTALRIAKSVAVLVLLLVVIPGAAIGRYAWRTYDAKREAREHKLKELIGKMNPQLRGNELDEVPIPASEDLRQNQTFLSLAPADQHLYLSSANPVYKDASPKDQARYLAYITDKKAKVFARVTGAKGLNKDE